MHNMYFIIGGLSAVSFQNCIVRYYMHIETVAVPVLASMNKQMAVRGRYAYTRVCMVNPDDLRCIYVVLLVLLY